MNQRLDDCVTREELEKEKVTGLDKSQVLCETRDMCSRHGDYMRCYLDTFVRCPFYKTYKAQGEMRR